VDRTRVGLAAVLAGVLSLAVAWWMVDSAGVSGAVGTIAAVVLAAGLLLVAQAGGEAAIRITGGLLCIAGLAVAITQHQLWWWLRTGWETPMTVASLLIALGGLGVLLFAHGFRMAGLSGACGVLAAVALATVPLPYLGSEDEAVLRAFAAALGAVALVAGFRAVDRPPLAGSRPARGALIALSALAVAFAGLDAYGTYAPTGYRVATVVATVAGVVAVLVVGTIRLGEHTGGPVVPAMPTPGRTDPTHRPDTPPGRTFPTRTCRTRRFVSPARVRTRLCRGFTALVPALRRGQPGRADLGPIAAGLGWTVTALLAVGVAVLTLVASRTTTPSWRTR
jgi:hypothetical protein